MLIKNSLNHSVNLAAVRSLSGGEYVKISPHPLYTNPSRRPKGAPWESSDPSLPLPQ